MFRKRRRPTPGFKIPPPFNPVSGDFANLGVEGVFPYCAMMQVAAPDEYEEYVICRGFDTRILKFVDFELGNPQKPGISVAKPFGCRGPRKYKLGEIYPAFLPTQGSLEYTPPSPTSVLWRIGQNPGAVDTGAANGGHPSNLSAEVELLYDHNQNIVNWMFIHSANEQFFRFELLADLISDTTTATVKRMDGTDPLEQTVHDPDMLFTGAEAGAKGLAFFQDGKYYIVYIGTSPAFASDTLERFVMTSNWYGGLATATFVNLSEPGWPIEYGIVEDPLGIFTDILAIGGQGLSTRTRYGRHYVIQAKCDQAEVPPVDPVGSCQVYTESSGLQCFVTTEAVCNLFGGTYGGDGTTCS